MFLDNNTVKSGYNEGSWGAGAEQMRVYAENRYSHEACTVCHQGALPIESALRMAAKMLIHVQACVS